MPRWEKLFRALNEEYGLKEQGLLTQYLVVEVEQTAENIHVYHRKYSQEILERFGFEEMHAVGNPMEVHMRLCPVQISASHIVKLTAYSCFWPLVHDPIWLLRWGN